MTTYSSILACKNPMDRGDWGAPGHGVPKESGITLATEQQNIPSSGGTSLFIHSAAKGHFAFNLGSYE